MKHSMHKCLQFTAVPRIVADKSVDTKSPHDGVEKPRVFICFLIDIHNCNSCLWWAYYANEVIFIGNMENLLYFYACYAVIPNQVKLLFAHEQHHHQIENLCYAQSDETIYFSHSFKCFNIENYSQILESFQILLLYLLWIIGLFEIVQNMQTYLF